MNIPHASPGYLRPRFEGYRCPQKQYFLHFQQKKASEQKFTKFFQKGGLVPKAANPSPGLMDV